jgi:hypothetical protein
MNSIGVIWSVDGAIEQNSNLTMISHQEMEELAICVLQNVCYNGARREFE